MEPGVVYYWIQNSLTFRHSLLTFVEPQGNYMVSMNHYVGA